MLLLYKSSVFLMDDGLVDFVDVLLMDDWLMDLIDNWLGVFVKNVLVMLMKDIFVMFMNHILMHLLDDRCLNLLLDDRSFHMLLSDGASFVDLDLLAFVMSDDNGSLFGGFSLSLTTNEGFLAQAHITGAMLLEALAQVSSVEIRVA
jgi:hypothetical protein